VTLVSYPTKVNMEKNTDKNTPRQLTEKIIPKNLTEPKKEEFLGLLLSGDYVDGVCEGVYASYVLVNIDSDCDSL